MHGGHEDHRGRGQLARELRRRGAGRARATPARRLRNIKAVDVVSTGLRGDDLDEWRALVRISFLVERVSE